MRRKDPRDRRIAELEAKLTIALATIEKLLERNAVLEARVADLEARRNQNSGNPSKPPSSDGLGSKP